PLDLRIRREREAIDPLEHVVARARKLFLDLRARDVADDAHPRRMGRGRDETLLFVVVRRPLGAELAEPADRRVVVRRPLERSLAPPEPALQRRRWEHGRRTPWFEPADLARMDRDAPLVGVEEPDV